MTGLVMAAGMGNRMGEFTKNIPKVLLEVGGKALLSHAIDVLRTRGCDRVVVLGGYRFDEVVDYCAKVHPEVQCVENPEYTKQNLVSFQRALQEIEFGDLFVVNSDYVFGESVLNVVRDLVGGDEMQVVCSSDIDAAEDDVMKVKVVNGFVNAMSKQLEDFEMVYTGMFFVPAGLLDRVRDACDRLLQTCDQQITPVEVLFGALDIPIRVVDVGLADWYEIDTPEEYQGAKDKLG